MTNPWGAPATEAELRAAGVTPTERERMRQFVAGLTAEELKRLQAAVEEQSWKK